MTDPQAIENKEVVVTEAMVEAGSLVLDLDLEEDSVVRLRMRGVLTDVFLEMCKHAPRQLRPEQV